MTATGNGKTGTRRQAREWAIQMLTSADLNPPENVDSFIKNYWMALATIRKSEGGFRPDELADISDDLEVREFRGLTKLRAFAEERVAGVLANIDEIDEILRPLLENWDIFRLGTVERAVLRMGIWEMKWSDVPPPVVINEAVDLVNWFSSPKSRSLVNGVLDRYAQAM